MNNERQRGPGGTGFIAAVHLEPLRRGYDVRQCGTCRRTGRARRDGGRSRPATADVLAADPTTTKLAHRRCRLRLRAARRLPLGATPGADLTTPLATAHCGCCAAAVPAWRAVMTSAAAPGRPDWVVSDETIWADPDDHGSARITRRSWRSALPGICGHLRRTTTLTDPPGRKSGRCHRRSVRVRIIDDCSTASHRRSCGSASQWWTCDPDLHIRAMTAPGAAGQRFLAAGEFMWMEDIARTLRSQLGPRAGKVPTRRLPDFVFRLISRFIPDLRALAPLLGRVTTVSSEKARRLLSFSPRPAATTVVDTAGSLMA